MYKTSVAPIILLIILQTTLLSLFGQEKWTQVTDNNGIIVYTRPVKGSDLNEFRGVATVNARLETVGEVLRDINNYTAWVADITESRIIKKYGGDQMLIYLLQKAPWPVSNREMLLKVNSTNNYALGRADIKFVAYNAADVPVKKGALRITDMDGSYILEYVTRETTRVTYTVRSNPGGSLPASVANMAAKDLPYRTLTGLKKQVSLSVYIEAGKKSPDRVKIEEAVKEGKLR